MLDHDIDYGTPASTSTKEVTLTIDGMQVTVPEGTSLMRAAMDAGTQIPKLCATDSLEPSAPAACAWWRSKAVAASPLRAPRLPKPA